MVTSIRLAEYKNEGDDEELITEIIVDMQDPAAPVFETACRREGPHDTCRVIARLSEIVDDRATAIDQNLPFSVGAVEIHVSHAPLPSNDASLSALAAKRANAFAASACNALTARRS